MKRENLILALMLAIADRENTEYDMGYTMDSSLLRGWKETLERLENGERVEIKD